MACFHGTSLLPVLKEPLSPVECEAFYSFYNVCRTTQMVTNAEYKQFQILKSSRENRKAMVEVQRCLV